MEQARRAKNKGDCGRFEMRKERLRLKTSTRRRQPTRIEQGKDGEGIKSTAKVQNKKKKRDEERRKGNGNARKGQEEIESGACVCVYKERAKNDAMKEGKSWLSVCVLCVSCDTAPSLRRFVLFVCPTYLLRARRYIVSLFCSFVHDVAVARAAVREGARH